MTELATKVVLPIGKGWQGIFFVYFYLKVQKAVKCLLFIAYLNCITNLLTTYANIPSLAWPMAVHRKDIYDLFVP